MNKQSVFENWFIVNEQISRILIYCYWGLLWAIPNEINSLCTRWARLKWNQFTHNNVTICIINQLYYISNIINFMDSYFWLLVLLEAIQGITFQCKMFVSIYSILVYFIIFSFQVLTCLRIVSIHIILNLNKFRQVWTC